MVSVRGGLLVWDSAVDSRTKKEEKERTRKEEQINIRTNLVQQQRKD